MTVMKYIIQLLFFSGILALSSCGDFLDIKPTGSVIPQTLDEYRALLTGAYSGFPSDRGVVGFRADEMQVNETDEFDMANYGDMQIWIDRPSSDASYTTGWIDYYSTIFIANEIIDAYNDKTIKDGSQEELNQLAGEAYMMRAYCHFILVNFYGQPYTKPGALTTKAVPLKLNNDLEAVLTRNTVEEVYKSILDDMSFARQLINVKIWDENKYLYRFNTTSVAAFDARIALYIGNWENAYNKAEEVIASQAYLEDLNAADAVVPTLYTCGEVITAMELTPSQQVTRTAFLTPTFIDMYDVDDLRFGFYFEGPNQDGYYTSKKTGYTQYRQTFRVGEFYLTSAEAAANKDDLSQARKRLLELMKKRYNPAGYSVKETAVNAMSKSELIEEILAERARELAFEGHRWYDLRRTTRPQIIKEINGQTYTLQQDDPRYTIQIPKDAIEANPGLEN